MKVKNIGPWDMHVPLGTYESVVVKQGETADLPDMLAAELVTRTDHWQAADDAPAKSEKAKKVAD